MCQLTDIYAYGDYEEERTEYGKAKYSIDFEGYDEDCIDTDMQSGDTQDSSFERESYKCSGGNCSQFETSEFDCEKNDIDRKDGDTCCVKCHTWADYQLEVKQAEERQRLYQEKLAADRKAQAERAKQEAEQERGKLKIYIDEFESSPKPEIDTSVLTKPGALEIIKSMQEGGKDETN